MNLKKTLSPAVMFPALEAPDKDSAIEAMVRALAGAHGVNDLDPLLECVFNREKKDSTGLEHGIGVPHGKTDAVAGLMAGIGRLIEPVEYGTRDGSAVRLLVMTISPVGRTGPHLQFIGDVVRLLRDEAHRNALLAAADLAARYAVMVR
jgi:mannitol/fructose-specific phosphotransferase system IIA component (Ntr-type)